MSVQKNFLLALWRMPALLIWIIVMPLLFFILKALKIPFCSELPHIFHFGVQKIFGLKVSHSGELSRNQPTLFVSNHISYLDVFVLGGIRAYFIAKSEVAKWPVLGALARFQNTLFFERNAGRAAAQIAVMKRHMSGGKSLILFPEGTSTDGVHVEPFKSSLFEAANLHDQVPRNKNSIPIQALTIAYTKHAGLPMNQGIRDHYAWYATMPFASHFFTLFFLKKVEVKVHYHQVCYLEQFDSRKQCAEHCQSLVEQKLHAFIESSGSS